LHEFEGFIATSRLASQDLQKFNSAINRAVDHVLAITQHTNRLLNRLPPPSHHARFSFLSLLGRPPPPSSAHAALLSAYATHTSMVADQISSLISTAQALLLVLNSLEDRLEVIHGVVAREHASLTGNRDD